jgi:predicted MFS family arabinose efflux permease
MRDDEADSVIGTLTAGPLIERFNHRNVMYLMCFLSFLGVALEATSKHYVQFLFGRIVLYSVSRYARRRVMADRRLSV